MSLNYFSIMEAADKEMTHSAMLRFLLHNAPPVLALFSPFVRHENALRVSLEETRKTGNNKRARFDLVARSGGQTLVVENKFKSFPTAAQLKRYDDVLRGVKDDFPNPVKYLLCFDTAALAGLVETNKANSWHTIGYDDIRAAVSRWLDGEGRNAPLETRVLCEHYVRFLEAYCATFLAVHEDYSLAFCSQDEQAAARRESDETVVLSAEESARPAGDPNFWQTLVLHQVGLMLEKRFVYKCGDTARKAIAEERLIVHSQGASATPNMNIQPPDWLDANGRDFQVCIQIQGQEMKLYIKGLKNETVRTDAVAYAQMLNGLIQREWNEPEAKMSAHTKSSNSFYVYKDVDSLLKGKTSVADLSNKIWEFYQRTDKIVQAVKHSQKL